MILIGLGSNLTTEHLKSSEQVLESALIALKERELHVTSRSSWFRSAPVPISDQPWFVNGVACVATGLPPVVLLAVLHEIEGEFGRVRSVRNANRTLDLDLLAYDDAVIQEEGGLTVPHPRLSERAFVLAPLAEMAPTWRHPVSGLTAAEMLAKLPGQQQVERLG